MHSERYAFPCLAELLAKPIMTLPACEAMNLWQISHAQITATLPASLEDFPDLPVRLRGALGHALAALPQRTDHRGRLRPNAFKWCFEPQGKLSSGDEIAKPLVIKSHLQQQQLIVDLYLAGMAEAVLNDVIEAMLMALHNGIALSARGNSLRVGIDAKEVTVERVPSFEGVEFPSTAALNFITPVIVRNKSRLAEDVRAILRSMVRRTHALSPWLRLNISDNTAQISAYIDALEYDDRNLNIVNLKRYSIRQKSQAIPMQGYLGSIGITGNISPLLPYLHLCSHMNAGSHTALGMGAFEINLYP
jgi:hypothetical protein